MPHVWCIDQHLPTHVPNCTGVDQNTAGSILQSLVMFQTDTRPGNFLHSELENHHF